MPLRFLSPADAEKVRSRFETELEGAVQLLLFAQPPSGLYVPGREEPQTGREAQALLEEVTGLSDKLTLEVHNPRLEPELAAQHGIERSPALIIQADGWTGGQVRFFGLPGGYEFSTLLEDIIDISRGKTRLTEATRTAIASLPGPVHLQVFVTPT